jgi:hypothetical protein
MVDLPAFPLEKHKEAAVAIGHADRRQISKPQTQRQLWICRADVTVC